MAYAFDYRGNRNKLQDPRPKFPLHNELSRDQEEHGLIGRMMRLGRTGTWGLTLCLLFASNSYAQLAHCVPSANCGSDDTPCTNWIGHNDTEQLTLAPTFGDGVFRIRICKEGDTLCNDQGDNEFDRLNVWGFSGEQQIFNITMNSDELFDTGPYTSVPELTHLRIRCVGTFGFCKIIWQACREQPPVQFSFIDGSDGERSNLRLYDE